MRQVHRSEPAPDDLIQKGEDELAKALVYYEVHPPHKKCYPFKTYKLKSVKEALERMFHGKCAYCETFYASTQPLDVEHFRPKGAVADVEGHRGYWWLAMKWENLLPSCIDCNRKRNQITPNGDTSQVRLLTNTAGFTGSTTIGSGKKDSFPIANEGVRAVTPNASLSNEFALLLDPCNDEPDKHLAYFFDLEHPVSFVVARKLDDDLIYSGAEGLSLKGATSIHVYGLNRLRLVQARTEVLRRLEFLAGLAIDLKLLADELEENEDSNVRLASFQIAGFGDEVVAELARMGNEDKPYSAMVKAWLKEFMERLENVT